ncbi:hypothetical protein SARC_17272, partial [Sphaeroforma arctica JP610]
MLEELAETENELEIARSDLTREQTDGDNLRRRHRAALRELDSVREERDSVREEPDTAARSARDRHPRGSRTG